MAEIKANILACRATCNRMHDARATKIESEAHRNGWRGGCQWTHTGWADFISEVVMS